MGELKFDILRAREIMETTCQETDLSCTIQDAGLDAIDRIEELEKMLVEAEAVSLHNFQRYETAICDAKTSPAWDDLGEEERAGRLDFSRKMLHMEGKL